MSKRCQYHGPVGDHRDVNGWCLEPAERTTDARALERPDDSLELCAEHHQVVKAYFLDQAAAMAERRGPGS